MYAGFNRNLRFQSECNIKNSYQVAMVFSRGDIIDYLFEKNLGGKLDKNLVEG